MVIDNLIETHSHILPGIDDGAKDVAVSIKLISQLSAQGATSIIMTPHFYSDSISMKDFLTKRDDAFNMLKKEYIFDTPKLIPAAEVYVSRYLFNYDDLTPLCIGNSRYMLVEYPFFINFSQKTFETIRQMTLDYKVKPILAHIERYKALMTHPELLDELIDVGCLMQVNISSFADYPKRIKKKLFNLLEANRIHFIGTDCHNTTTRQPVYGDGAKEIIANCGRGTFDALISNASKILL